MTQPEKPIISPLNDVNISVLLINVPSSGTKTPITSPPVTGFLATSNAPDATAADPTLQADLTHVGGNDDGDGGTYDLGTWMFQLNATAMTIELLDSLFKSTRPWLIVQKTGDRRNAIPLRYARVQQATLEG